MPGAVRILQWVLSRAASSRIRAVLMPCSRRALIIRKWARKRPERTPSAKAHRAERGPATWVRAEVARGKVSQARSHLDTCDPQRTSNVLRRSGLQLLWHVVPHAPQPKGRGIQRRPLDDHCQPHCASAHICKFLSKFLLFSSVFKCRCLGREKNPIVTSHFYPIAVRHCSALLTLPVRGL